MVTLPTLIPISEAARKYGLDEAHLRQLVEKGKIRAGVVAGEMVVSEEEVRSESVTRKEDLPEWKQFAHLNDKGIGLAEAAEKYRVNIPTIYRWYKTGIIKEIGRKTVRGGTKILLNEADVAYCVFVYQTSRWSQGKRVFNKSGLPYTTTR
ncbi:hypothetical protein [Bellilinea sp.]|uniref:hypothetical protein n=1 Tax=Bellilinea sp. TaxID=2838785 RepID=UPI0021DC67E7|nr:hypothetical protein [Bellilinea sp.]GIV64795.1 MAG: hypothetical protein KatS3mg046_055 [Bellilinea sp.]